MTLTPEQQREQKLLMGICPECDKPVRDWKPPFGAFAPEAFATLKELNINPGTGHKIGCNYDTNP